ncbi:MAG: ABC transporter ATP-binding protein [Flavobacteriales bacterium]|nr:ABC transporter ATP-binding protein [Flavobacteriales bacterium]
MIELKNILKVYRTQTVETTAVNHIDLKINAGEFIAIMGPSGCGKSTLLNIIGTLDSFNEGSYLFENIQVKDLNSKQKTNLRKKNIGFIFQNFNLIDGLNVFENIELPLLYNNVSKKERIEKVEEIMQRLNIQHRAKHFPQQLSGGQQQRVAIARALVHEPSLILADEPTGNLDSTNGNEVMQLLNELHHQGKTIVMVTHSNYDARFSSKIIEMRDGALYSEQQTLKSFDLSQKK